MEYTAAVITISDKGSRGERQDTSGPAICKLLSEEGYRIVHTAIVPDEADIIKDELIFCADKMSIALIVTTGGTGFSPRDITPEATLEVLERQAPGIAEAMRAASMKITNRGCLSRGVCGIRKRSLIVNLPGSEKAAKENIESVLSAIEHGISMLLSEGSADCALNATVHPAGSLDTDTHKVKKGGAIPSVDEWLKEAKSNTNHPSSGMYLIHNGVVRNTPRALVREGDTSLPPVVGMDFSFDEDMVNTAIEDALGMEGIFYVKVWLNTGRLRVGDDIMLVMIGGDIRPHVIDALQTLVGRIKNECVTEKEIWK